jgi:hypothetical protein
VQYTEIFLLIKVIVWGHGTMNDPKKKIQLPTLNPRKSYLQLEKLDIQVPPLLTMKNAKKNICTILLQNTPFFLKITGKYCKILHFFLKKYCILSKKYCKIL